MLSLCQNLKSIFQNIAFPHQLLLPATLSQSHLVHSIPVHLLPKLLVCSCSISPQLFLLKKSISRHLSLDSLFWRIALHTTHFCICTLSVSNYFLYRTIFVSNFLYRTIYPLQQIVFTLNTPDPILTSTNRFQQGITLPAPLPV